ncbi:acyl carrier protein [Azohydromonas australica]|uniref:acyl carrier protein n=1 Tax=Azohydromonas australica TaxID=364039 RepID=UPI00041E2BE8|nr:acyl carrier protein [Azohydromonas australica]
MSALMNPSAAATSVADVSERIRQRLTQLLRENQVDFKEAIGDDMSFDYIGLDSLARVNLLSALDEEFGIALDATAAYDFVTVGALSQYVWSQLTGEALDLKKVLEV